MFSELLYAVQRKERPIALIASLPRNDPALAEAALEGGADVLKVHINLHHRASGTTIEGLSSERGALEEILALRQGSPVGIVPGTRASVKQDEISQLAAMGFDFVSLYLSDTPIGILPPPGQLERMLAFHSGDNPDLAEYLEALNVQVCELSIMEPDTYGQILTYQDLMRYAAFRRKTRLPLVVPSQHQIPPEALPELVKIGMDAVMLGSIVCGSTPESWKETFHRFDLARRA